MCFFDYAEDAPDAGFGVFFDVDALPDAFVALLGDDLAEVRRVFFAGAGPLARFAAIRSAASWLAAGEVWKP